METSSVIRHSQVTVTNQIISSKTQFIIHVGGSVLDCIAQLVFFFLATVTRAIQGVRALHVFAKK